MDTKITVVIPYYESRPDKKEILHRCTSSLPKVHEIIIVWNDRMGYAPAINRGCVAASGDHFLIMNDDVIFKSGDLQDLCIPGKATSPTYNGRTYPDLWGSCFCVPRDIWERMGGMDERYEVSYYDDDDLIFTLRDMGVPMGPVESVVFDHPHPGTTLDVMPDRTNFSSANEQRFKEKWGRLP